MLPWYFLIPGLTVKIFLTQIDTLVYRQYRHLATVTHCFVREKRKDKSEINWLL